MSAAPPWVLLVEDNSDDEELALKAFKASASTCKVVVARDGVEALETLFAAAATPRLVLLDLRLPKLEGLAVLAGIRADRRTRLIPVVMLSSSRETEDLQESYRLGANGYVRKPVDYEKFVEVVRRLSLYWLEVNEPPTRGPPS